MTTAVSFAETDTVGSIVAHNPALSRVFEKLGIDYCCGGKIALDVVCRKKGLALPELLASLERAAQEPDLVAGMAPLAMTLTELANHIEATHHAYLREEMPRMDMLTEKVARVHGDKDPALIRIRNTYSVLHDEMTMHMMKEEQILFPMIRRLDDETEHVQSHCGSIANPIRQMEHEHDQVGAALALFRSLSNGYQPPEWACNTYRAMLNALAKFEEDMHQHVHKENNILFPRAIAAEGACAAGVE